MPVNILTQVPVKFLALQLALVYIAEIAQWMCVVMVFFLV